MFAKLKRYHWLSLFVAFIAVNNVVAATFSLANQYYIVMGAALLILLALGGISNVKMLYVIFAVVCAISIAVNDIPDIFRPWGRYVTFVLVTGLISPMFQSPLLSRFRQETFILVMYLILLVTIISFFAAMAGVNYMREAAGQTGITTQVMLMGPIAGVSLVFCVYMLWVQKTRRIGAIEKGIYLLGLFTGFAMNLMAVSRIGIVAAATGVVALIVYKSRFKPGKAMLYVVLIAGALILTRPLWNTYSAQVEEKNEKAERQGGMLSSRQNNWDQRIEEFESSPIIGIGFSAVELGDDNVTEVSNSGTVETGSGWLLVLSMTGLAGFIPFALMFFKAFAKTRRMVVHRFVEPYCLLGALLAMFSVHMIAEGYSLAAGGLMFFIVWLLLGTIDCWPLNRKSISL